MKNYYLLIFLIIPLTISAQGDCDYANSYLVSAYSHVKDSYESNNINHLQYYANRSLESFRLAKKELSDCNCEAALELTDKCIDLLAKVDTAEKYEDGRFYVKRARDYSKNSVIEIDKCSAAAPTDDSADLAEDDSSMSELERLKQQQEALMKKEAEIKKKLEDQKKKARAIEKKQLVLSYKNAIRSNVNTYNETLNACKCKNYTPFRDNTSEEDVSAKTISEIKAHYNVRIKSLATEYLSLLNSCDE